MLASSITSAMRTICSSLQIPVIVALMFILAVTLIVFGSVLVELIFERRYLKVWMPKLVDDLKAQEMSTEETIQKSGLLKRQKMILIELTKHKELTPVMREALAVRLLTEYKARFEGILRISDLIVKLGPAFGLLGTLIPLGPGIVALGQGDTYTLSQSLLTAFDTTIMGLSCAAVSTVISSVRKRWYANDLSIMEALIECILEVEKENA